MRLAALAVLALLSAAGLAAAAAQAQSVQPTVTVAATISAEPAGQAPLTIRIDQPGALPKGSFIRVRGLPPIVALSEGHSLAPGSWAIPIAALPKLKVTLPQMPPGRSEISIALIGSDGSILAETATVLVIAAVPQPDRQAQGKTEPPPMSILRAGAPLQAPEEKAERPPQAIPADAGGKLTPEQRDRATRLVKRGDEHLAEGGIAQARLLYERAAEAGLAQGAMALAATYDAAELERLGVRGLQPDRAQAVRWYERARQMGAQDADQRLRRLGAK
jgi:hypothetical protein